MKHTAPGTDVNMLSWALWYATRGVPVFPLPPGTKHPYERSHGFKDATTNLNTITKWWNTTPNANIAGRCGVVFDVLDVDVKITTDGTVLKDGRPAMHQLNNHGLLAGWIGIATTRHGGTHLFYPTSGHKKSSIAAQHIDYQAAGSYVVLPPSIVKPDEDITGPGSYQWTTQLDIERENSAPFDWATATSILHPEPDGVLAMFTAARTQFRRDNASIDKLAKWLAKQHPESGNRNKALFWACMRAIEDGLNPDELKSAAKTTGLTDKEITRTINSARARGRKETA